jgi:WW domain-containing transcription regulator protein 1
MNHQHQQVVATSLSPQNHPTQNQPTGLMSVPNALTTQQQQQQKLRLQRIQMERERIRMRQEELMRQVWSSMVPAGDSVALGGCLLSR